MIHFDIIKSPDENVLTTFKFFQNQIYIGTTNGDLWIDDPEIKSSHAMLEVIQKDLIMHPQKDVEFYLINGKRASTVRKIKINDELTFGKTIIKVIGFEETLKESKKEILDKKLQNLLRENSPKLGLIEHLTQKMK